MNTNEQSNKSILLGVDYGDFKGDFTTRIYGYVREGVLHIVDVKQSPMDSHKRGTWIRSAEHS